MLLTEAKRWENILYNYFRENHPDLADSWNQPIRNLLTQEQINTMEAQHQNIDTPLIVYYKAKFCSLFDINRGKGPIKYVPGLARISFNELGLNMTRLVTENNCPQEIGTLKNLVRFIECTPGLNEKFDEDLNGLSYFELYDEINPMRKTANRLNQEKLSSLKLQNKNYRVIPINSQKEASRYSEYTSWCITTMMDQWENYTRFGRRFYFLLKDGFENVPRPADPEAVGAPFDAYGLSMISVLVDMEGEPVHVTTRYNHKFNGENNPDLHTAEQVQNITGINFYKELKPYTREELHSMGIILFDEVPELLASGKDIDEIFDEVINCYEISDEVNGYGEFYRVHLNGKYNFLHKKHNTLVLLCRRWYNMMYRFSEGLAKVELNNKFGYIDRTGREVIPCKYNGTNNFKEGLAAVNLNGKCGVIDKTGREICPCKYDWINDFSEGLAQVELNDKLGIIDKSGKEVIPCKYDSIYDFKDGLSKVSLNGKFGYIDKTGKEICPCKYDGIGDFVEGLAPVILNWKLGFIDKTGREVIPLKYDSASQFYEGLAHAKLNGKQGYIDKQGNWYDEKPSILPESITKITISDIRYMVNECVNRLNEMGYNPREYLPRVRGGWTQPKITKQLKKNGSLSGPLESIRLIAEFDNVDELRSHIFWHGSKYIQTSLKPSIVLPKYQVERDGGGGYGKQYWGISLTSDKSIATIFGGTGSRGTWVHPVVLAKDAVVKAMPKLDDAIAAEDIIEELWNEGIDAIYIGGGESELLVLNPKCIANMEASQYYEYYRLYRSNVSNPSDEQLQELLDKCKMIVNGGGSFENGEQELETKRLMRKI